VFFLQKNVIHCIIWKSMIETYKTTVKENGVYIIQNFKVQEATTYRPVNNDLKIIFMFTTSVKEVKQLSIRYPIFHFDFATQEMLLERENKVIQCSGN
jgi:hypothetical protein